MTKTLRSLLLAGTIALGTHALGAPSPFASTVAHAEVSADAFGTLPLVRDGAISPDGTRMALYGTFNGKHGVRIINLSDGGVTNKGVMMPSGARPGWVRWANNDRVLISASIVDELYGTAFNVAQLYSYDVSNGKGDWLINPKKARRIGSSIGSDKTYFEFDYTDIIDTLPDDPDHILMSFADETTGVRPVHKVNVATGKYTTVERATTSIQGWATDTTGTVRVARGLMRGATDESQVNIRILDMDGEWKSREHWPGLDEDTSFYGFTAKPNEMVIGTRNGRDTIGLYVYDLTTRAISRKIFHDDEFDVDYPIRDRQTRDVIGAQFTGEDARVRLLPGHTRAFDKMTAAYKDFQVTYIDSSDNGETLLFKVSQPYDPGALLVLNKGDSTPMKIADYNPDLPSDEMGLVVPVKYTARDGQKIPAYVTLPPTVNDTASIKKLPFIVFPHGGPYVRDTKRFDYMAQFFASRGYGVLQMNFRGSTGYGEQFAEAGRKDWGVMRSDALDGAKWLVEKGYADPDRMCMGGWSFGGYTALMNGVENPDMFSCVISIAALSDLEGELADMKGYRFSKIYRRIITDGFADKQAIRDGSPVRVAERMTLPTFIAHGTMDVNVSYDQHKKLKRALKKSPAKVTELTFKDEDHFMSDQGNRQKMLRALDTFLIEANGPSEFVKK